MSLDYSKNTEPKIQKHRLFVQIAFVLLCIWIGIEFYFFINFLESGGASQFFGRPPGVEGFLPISSLMSIYYFLQTGIIHSVHPAGFFILLAVIIVSVVFGKSFCSWMCPIGFISETIADFSERIQKKLFKRIIRIPKFLDIAFRSIKYLLLGFFIYSIFFLMTASALKSFLDSPYNIMADVKMWYFFAEVTPFALTILTLLFLLSVLFRNFWCRYLCPYGALLGIMTLLSPNKIKRNTETCIDCALCAKACPSRIKVDKVKIVISDECSTCMSCVDVCPVADTLQLTNITTKKTVRKKLVTVGIIGIYVLVSGLGMITGYWQNNVGKESYLKYHEMINSLGHPRSAKEIENLNKLSNTNSKQQIRTESKGEGL